MVNGFALHLCGIKKPCVLYFPIQSLSWCWIMNLANRFTCKAFFLFFKINSKVTLYLFISSFTFTLKALFLFFKINSKVTLYLFISSFTFNLKAFFTNNFHFLLQGFSASYVIIDESEGRDYEYIDKAIPS